MIAAWQQQIGVFHTYSEWHIVQYNTFYAAQSEVNNTSYQTIGHMVLVMASSSTSSLSSESPTRQRLHLQRSFSSPEEKDVFQSRFEAARQLLAVADTRGGGFRGS